MVTALACMCVTTDRAEASPGDLDETFGKGGVIKGEASAIAVQPDRKTVLVHGSNLAGSLTVTVARVTVSGLPDRAFSADGRKSFEALSSGPGTAYATDVALTPQGQIVVAVSIYMDGLASQIAIARLTSEGTLDQSFGSGGVAVLGRSLGAGGAVATDSSGGIVASVDEGVVRLTPDGRLDTRFSEDGIAETGASVVDMALGADDSVFAFTVGDTVEVQKLNSAGDADQGFGDGGRALVRSYVDSSQQNSITVDPFGRIVVASYGCVADLGPGPPEHCAGILSRLTASGAADDSFDGYAPGQASLGGLARVDAESRVIVAGNLSPRRGLGEVVVVRRQMPTGELDQRFGFGGLAYAGAASLGQPIDLEIGPDEKITAATHEGEVARFEIDDEPGDSDADGRSNAPDRCDFLYASTQTGCPRIKRFIELGKIDTNEYVYLQAYTRHPGCLGGQVVKLWRVTQHGDVLIERGRSDSRGGTPRFDRLRRGRYYATLGSDFKPGIGFCERARTPAFTLRHDLEAARTARWVHGFRTRAPRSKLASPSRRLWR